MHPKAARSPTDGHGDFKQGKHKGSGSCQHTMSVRKLRLLHSSCAVGRDGGVQIQGCNTRASFHVSTQCWTRRKEGGWPLAAPGVPAGPWVVPPLPCPPQWWPRRTQPILAMLPALPSPLPDHNTKCLRTQNQALPLKMPCFLIAMRGMEMRGFSRFLSNER